MSMDETFEQMQRFDRALNDFNEHLRQSVSELARSHAAVDPLWRDSFRRQYDAEWAHFQEAMIRYINREAPNYAQFLRDKLIQLRRYLYGS
ncbi:MAG TPA: hypothetical protein VGE07_22650 [Herpetosiphonaceae bacterium]